MNVSALDSFTSILKRDLLIAFRRRAETLNPLLFYILVVMMFPLAIDSNPELLQIIAPGIIWVAALLAALLSLDALFRSDFEDGFLEVMLLSPHSLYVMVLAKITAHWLVCGLPLVIIAPVLGLSLGLPVETLDDLIWSILLGTPVLSFIGAIGTALILGLRGGGMLISLLVLPLYIPILIYGAGTISTALHGGYTLPYFLILGAFLMLAFVFAPWATAAALRISVE